jgi:hypothetical protein
MGQSWPLLSARSNPSRERLRHEFESFELVMMMRRQEDAQRWPPENKCGAEIARYRRAHGQVTVILLAKLAPMPILASEVTSA